MLCMKVKIIRAHKKRGIVPTASRKKVRPGKTTGKQAHRDVRIGTGNKA